MCELNKGELKKALEEMGFYEDGMNINDMKQMYNTIKQSKDSATQENEFRELLSSTEANRSSLELLRSKDQITIEYIKKDSDKRPLNKCKKINNSTDDIFDELKNDEICPIIENKMDQTKSKQKLSDFPKNYDDSQDEEKINEDNKKTKKIELSTQTLIDCSSAFNNYKPLNLKVSKGKPNAYYHPMIWKLPRDTRAQIIFKFHSYKLLKYKNYASDLIQPNSWGEPIQASRSKEFNGDLFVDYVPDTSDDDITEKPMSSSSSDVNSLSQRKSTRQTKRKCYIENNSSEDDDFVKSSKKTKSNMVMKNISLNSTADYKTSENNGKWLSKIKTESKSSLLNYANDRTKKILNNAEKVVEKSKNTKKQETMDVTDDDEDAFVEIKTVVDVHNSVTPKKDTRPNPANPFIKKRNAARKRETKPTNDVDEILVDNSAPEIATYRFYKTRNHPEKPDSPPPSSSESMTECPICLRSFKVSVIESHASSCTQFSEPMTPCEFCRVEIPQSELKSHGEKCFDRHIVADNKADSNNDIKSLHLCSVCDKYFQEMLEFQAHLPNCIESLSHS